MVSLLSSVVVLVRRSQPALGDNGQHTIARAPPQPNRRRVVARHCISFLLTMPALGQASHQPTSQDLTDHQGSIHSSTTRRLCDPRNPTRCKVLVFSASIPLLAPAPSPRYSDQHHKPKMISQFLSDHRFPRRRARSSQSRSRFRHAVSNSHLAIARTEMVRWWSV